MPPPAIDYGSLGRIGLLLPSVNQAAEPQLRAMLPPGLAMAVTRLPLADTSERALLAMADGVEQAARMLAEACCSLIVFHCTAVTTYSPQLEASILARITRATGVPARATSQALVAALQALKARRIVMLSPYPAAVDERERRFFQARGFEVLDALGRGCMTASDMMRVSPEEWIEMGLQHARPEAQSYLMSCTTVRTAEAVEALEARLQRPVITSNTAMAWDAMRQLGIDACVPGFGRLLGAWPA